MFENRMRYKDGGGESVAVSGRAKPSVTYVFPSENNHSLEGKHGHTNMTTALPYPGYTARTIEMHVNSHSE